MLAGSMGGREDVAGLHHVRSAGLSTTSCDFALSGPLGKVCIQVSS